MSFLLFEESGALQAGRVMQAAAPGAHWQIEMPSGKRMKIKEAQGLLEFDAPTPEALLPEAKTLSEQMDAALLWEAMPQEDFLFSAAAQEYFGAKNITAVQAAAAWLLLFAHPHFFRRLGSGHFRPAPREQVQAALRALERKAAEQERIERWSEALQHGTCPPEIARNAYRLLFAPEKTQDVFKALEHAAQRSHLTPLALLQKIGAVRSAFEYHHERFQVLYGAPQWPELPSAQCDALHAARQEALQTLNTASTESAPSFSIDDSSTTEIDDAFSAQWITPQRLRVGIHIALPAALLLPEGDIAQGARQRGSTLYCPGEKATMLPEILGQLCSLDAGQERLALTLQLDFNGEDFSLLEQRSRVTRLKVAANIRYDQLAEQFAALQSGAAQSGLADAQAQGSDATAPAAIAPERWQASALGAADAFKESLVALHRLSLQCRTQREKVRGKPEGNFGADFQFVFPDGAPVRGDEGVKILRRQRGTVLDFITAEMMILANSHWARLLSERQAGALFREQPGGFGRARTVTRAAPHQGIGAAHYAWCTSPLRRYCDLRNQWQLLALLAPDDGAPAQWAARALAANSPQWLAEAAQFESAYEAAGQFQTAMESYWALVFLQQQGIKRTPARALRDGVARLEELPLFLRADGTAPPPGESGMIEIGTIDLFDLSAQAKWV